MTHPPTPANPVPHATATALLDHGVRTLFGLMGDANMLYVASYRERGGRYVASAHEAGAVAMADAWSRMTGQIGVATVTHGPGLTNSMTALVEAVRGRDALLLLTGDTPEEPTHFQRIDLAALACAAGAGYERVGGADSLVRDLNRALQRTRAESRPIVFDLPARLLPVDAGHQSTCRRPVALAPAAPPPEDLDGALGLLASAERPIVLAGRGAVQSGARGALIALAEILGAPLATSVLAKGLFTGHPSNLGICGSLAHPVAAQTISTADTIIAFGASLNKYTTYERELISGKRLIQVDHDPARFGSYTTVDEAVAGDARLVAHAMTETLRDALDGATPRARSRWLDAVHRNLATHRPEDDFTDQSGPDTIDPRTASIKLNAILPEPRNLVSDLGRFVNAAWPYLEATDASRFTAMGGFGSIGLGLAGAVGAALARPDASTVALIGDGGFMMNPAELITAVREKLELIVLVYNDGAYGAEHHKLRLLGADPDHSLTAWPPVADVAESFGAQARTVRTVQELDELATLFTERTGPFVVDIRLDPAIDIITW